MLFLIWQKLETQVGDVQATRDQVQQEVQKLQKEGSEMKRKAKELQRSLDTEIAGWHKLQYTGVLDLINIWLKLLSEYPNVSNHCDTTCQYLVFFFSSLHFNILL